MDQVIKLNSQSAGRDKLARIVQYASRYIWSEMEKSQSDIYAVDQIKLLESTCSSFRKLLRFGRCVDSVYSASAVLSYPDYVVRFAISMSKVFNSFFLFADHVLWLARSGFLKNIDSNKWNRIANKYWLFSIIMNLMRDLYEMLNILYSRKSYIFSTVCDSEFDAVKYYAQVLHKSFHVIIDRKDVLVDTVKNLCDVWIPLAALGRVKLQPGTIGLLGAASSVAGLYALLQPEAKLSPI